MMNLDSALEKLWWAEQLLDRLDELDSELEDACRRAITREVGSDGGIVLYRMGSVPSVPREFALILGDTLHNLRTSLDHLVRAVVISEGLTPKDGPAGTTFRVLKTRPARFAITPEVSAAATAMIEGLQPFHDRRAHSHPLTVLTELDNVDKHRQLLTAVLRNHGAGWFGPIELDGWYPLSDDGLLATFKPDGEGSAPDGEATFHFGVCCPEEVIPTFWRGQPVARYVREVLHHHITGVVVPAIRAIGTTLR